MLSQPSARGSLLTWALECLLCHSCSSWLACAQDRLVLILPTNMEVQMGILCSFTAERRRHFIHSSPLGNTENLSLMLKGTIESNDSEPRYLGWCGWVSEKGRGSYQVLWQEGFDLDLEIQTNTLLTQLQTIFKRLCRVVEDRPVLDKMKRHFSGSL